MEKQLKFQSMIECVRNGKQVVYLSNPLYISLLEGPRFKNIYFNAPTKPIPSYTCAPKRKCKYCFNFCLKPNCNLNFSLRQNSTSPKCCCIKQQKNSNDLFSKYNKHNCGCHKRK